MPEMNQENNLNVDKNVTPTVPVEPETPVGSFSQEPVVEVAPTVEIPAVEIKDEVVENVPVVEVSPEEVVNETNVVEPSVMVNDIPEVLPATSDTEVENTVVTITPESVPAVEAAPVDDENSVNDVAPVVETNDNELTVETVSEPIDNIPVIETTPASEDAPSIFDNSGSDTPNTVVTNPGDMITPSEPSETIVSAPETPVTPANDNTSVNETPSAPTSEVVPDGGDAPKKEGKKVGLVVALGIVVILIGVGLGLYFFVFTKPVNMFKTSLNLLKTQLVKTTGEGTPMQLDLSFQTNLKSSDQTLQPMFDNINKLYLEGSIYLDLSNKTELLKLNTKYKEQDMLSADIFVEKENAFIKLNNIFDKYIKTVLEEDIFKETEGNDDTIVVLEGLIDALNSSLKSEYFTKVNKTANINNIAVELVANTLVINGENVGDFVKNITASLRNNDKFIDSFAKMQGMDKKGVTDLLAQIDLKMDAMSNEEKAAINYQVSFYTRGLLNNICGFGISTKDQAVDFYVVDGFITAFATVNDSTTKVLDAELKDGKYNVNVYAGSDTYSFILGYKVTEKPAFTKPDVSNSVDADKLTQDDTMTITTNLTQSPGMVMFMTDFQEIITMIQMLMGGGMNQPDVDFDSDFEDFDDSTIYLE